MRPFTAVTVKRDLYKEIGRLAKVHKCSRSTLVTRAIYAYPILCELQHTSPGNEGRLEVRS